MHRGARSELFVVPATAVVILAGARPAAAQARLFRLPDLPHSASIIGLMSVHAVTDDGYVIGGASDMNSQWYGPTYADTSFQAYRFSVATGETLALGKYASAMNFSIAEAISPDGSVIFGSSTTPLNALAVSNNRAFRWTLGTGPVQLGIIPGDPGLQTFSHIDCLTPGGSAVIGGSGTVTSYRWTEWPSGSPPPVTPFQFPDAAHQVIGEPVGVSDDASIVFGTSYQLNLAIFWMQTGTPFTSISLASSTRSKAVALTGDGRTFVGTSDPLYQGQHIDHVFRYRAETGVVDLNAAFHPETYHAAYSTSRDGNTIVGSYGEYPAGLPAWAGHGVGWIWRFSRGTVPLEAYLSQELGLSLKGLLHPVATAVSPSGRWIAGEAADPTDQEGRIAWLVDTGGPCYANCDASTAPPILNIADFICFLNEFAAADSYANCDNSTTQPVLNVNDFICFQSKFAQGCP